MLKSRFSQFTPALLLAAVSCTNVYFENPVPQKAAAISSVPEGLPGLYTFDNGQDPDETFDAFKNCILMEKANESQLMVSWETRLHEQDVPALKAQLEAKKAAGDIGSYTWTGHFLYCTVMAPGENDTRQPEQQFISLTKEGPWYIVSQTRQPFMLLDFREGTSTGLTAVKSGSMSKILPEADSLETESFRLDARTKDGAFYFNRLKEGSPGWELIYLQPQAAGGWLLKTSDVADDKEFESHLEVYNKITPFEKVDESKYRVNPSDPALVQLLKENNLFYTATLRKLER